jgi:hypothetical protein
MPPQEARIQSQLLAQSVAEHAKAVAKVTPGNARELLAAARRLSAAGAPAGRAPR